MPWVTFEDDWLWMPPTLRRAWSRQYRRGMVAFVPQLAATLAKNEDAARNATDEEIARARHR